MPDQSWFSLRNYMDRLGVAVTCAREQAQHPASNLRRINFSDKLLVTGLTAGDTDIEIDVDWGEDLTVGCAVLGMPRAVVRQFGPVHLSINETDTIRYRFYADGETPGDPTAHDYSGPANASARRAYSARKFATKFPARYCRVNIDAISRAETGPIDDPEKGDAAFGRLWFGDTFDPDYEFLYRHIDRSDVPLERSRSWRGGSTHADNADRLRQIKATYSGIHDYEAPVWRDEIDHDISTIDQFVYSLSSDAALIDEETFFASIEVASGLQSVDPDFWQYPATFLENR